MSIKIVFSVPGGGKTTYAVYLAKKALKEKKWQHVITNFPCDGTVRFDSKDLGKYHIEDSLFIIDEAGIEFNNRNWKNLTQEAVDYLKYHRHYSCDMWFFSQTYNDMDNKIRDLADEYYQLQKVGVFTYIRPIWKKVGVHKEEEQIMDRYGYHFITSWRWIYRPFYYKYFNSWACKQLTPFVPVNWNMTVYPITKLDKVQFKIRALNQRFRVTEKIGKLNLIKKFKKRKIEEHKDLVTKLNNESKDRVSIVIGSKVS